MSHMNSSNRTFHQKRFAPNLMADMFDFVSAGCAMLAMAAFIAILSCSPAFASIPGGIQITSPAYGSSVVGSSVNIQVSMDTGTDPSTLKVLLNGSDISSQFSTSGSCSGSPCTSSANVTSSLLPGENSITSSATGASGGIATYSTFTYQASAPSQLQVNYYEPLSLGLTTIPGGGDSNNNWVKVLTGTPVITDSSSGDSFVSKLPNPSGSSNEITIPYEDSTFSAPGSCSTTYQVVVLVRSAPSMISAPGKGEWQGCVSSEADFESQFHASLGRAPDSRDLIIFGTAPGQNAAAGLDTTAIGGTNYSKVTDQNVYPLTYVMIGVKGKAAGSAYESFSNTRLTTGGALNGVLTQDPNGNYNYLPSGQADFQVISSGAATRVTVGQQTFTVPSGVPGGSFMVVYFDRQTLQGNAAFYTPTSGPDVAAAMGDALSTAGSNFLLAIATVGCPFTSASQIPSNLSDAIQAMGGSKYVFNNLVEGVSDCSYALVSVNDGNHQALTSNVALSSGQFAANGEYGAIHGVLSISHDGRYDVLEKDQMGALDGADTFVPTIDSTYLAVSALPRQDWLNSDQLAKRKAYYDISNQLLSQGSVNVGGSHSYDIRYFYSQPGVLAKLMTIVASRIGPNAPAATALQPSAWDDAPTATFQSIGNQLYNEIEQASSASGFLLGTNGTDGVMSALAGTSTSMIQTAFDAVNNIGTDMNVAQTTQATIDMSAILNLGAAIVSAIAPIAGDELSPGLGVLSGALWTGSALDAPFTNSGTTGPESQYDMIFSNVQAAAATLSSNTILAFGASVNNVLSDPGKLATIGGLTQNQTPGWTISSFNDTTAISRAFTAGLKTQLYLEVVPQNYGVRTLSAVSNANPDNYGGQVENGYCIPVYARTPTPPAMITLPAAGQSGKWDVAILSEGLKAVKNGFEYAMGNPLAGFLTSTATLSGTSGPGLNLPATLLINNGPWTYAALDVSCIVPDEPNPNFKQPVFTNVSPLTTTITAGSTTAIAISGKLATSDGKTNASGSVTIEVGDTSNTATIDSKTGTFSLSFGPASLVASTTPYPVHITYAGSSNLLSATDDSASITVNAIPSSVALNVSPTSSVYGQTVTFTATVSSASKTPTGNVNFLANGNVISTQLLAPESSTSLNAIATYTSNTLAAGTYTITAFYAGDSSVSSGTSSGTQLRITKDSPVTISPSQPDTIGYYTPSVTLLGSVAANYSQIPAGELLNIQIGDVVQQTTTSAGGAFKVNVQTQSLVASTYTILYSFPGDNNYSPATNTSTHLTVAKITPNFTGVTASQTIGYGTPSISLSGNVAQSGVIPTGVVTARIGGLTSAPGFLDSRGNFQISFDTSAIPVSNQPYVITYNYSGDQNFNSQGDVTTTLTVSGMYLSTTLSSSANSTELGQPITFTANVISTAGTPTGTVTFQDGAAILGTALLTNGQAMFTTTGLTVGLHSILAVYGGNPNTPGATAPTVGVTVSKLPSQFSGLTPSQTVNSGAASIAVAGTIASIPANGSVMQYTSSESDSVGGIIFTYDATGVSTNAATYSVWINTTSKTQQIVMQAAFSHPRILMTGDQLTVQWEYWPQRSYVTWTSTDTRPISDGKWHQIAATFDQGKLTVYKDGVATSDDFTVDTADVAVSPMNLGGSDEHVPSFVGQMWNAKIWAAVLSPADIQAEMNRTYVSDIPANLQLLAVFDSTANTAVNLVDSSAATNQTASIVAASLPPYYPAPGEQVAISVGSVQQDATVGSAGAFAATVPVNNLTPGNYQIQYGYVGDGNLQQAADSSTSLTVSSNGSAFTNLTASQSITAGTASISLAGTVSSKNNGVPTGTVTATIDGRSSSSVSLDPSGGFRITFDTSSLPASTTPAVIIYRYSGDNNCTAVIDESTTLTVNGLATVTSVSSSPASGLAGQPVTLTAQVTSATGTPTGIVAFLLDGGASLATATLTNGQASYTTNIMPTGLHSITAVYRGNIPYLGSTSTPAYETVNKNASIFSSPTASQTVPYGTQSITLAGKVWAPNGPAGVAATTTQGSEDGNVGVFFTGLNATGISTDAATFSVWINTTNKGQQMILQTSEVKPAIYLQNDQISVVYPGESWTSADTTPVSDGEWHHIAVSFNQGKITFYKDGVATQDSFTVSSPIASDDAVNFGGGGVFTQILSFSGQMWNAQVWASASSASDIQAQMFPNYNGAYPAALRLLSSFDSNAGTATNLIDGSSARVDGVTMASATLPFLGQYPSTSESVEISIETSTDQVVTSQSATIGTNGAFSASVPIGSVAAGKYQIVYGYSGNAALSPASDDSTSLTVNALTTAFSNLAFAPEVIDVGANISATGNIAAGTVIPAGNVLITVSNGSQQAEASAAIQADGSFSTAIITSSLQPGVYTVTYSFAATANFNGVSNANGRLLVKAASSTSLTSSPNPSTLNQQVTFTATVTGPGHIPPSGTVTFTEGGTTLATKPVTNGAATYQTSSLAVGQNSITATYNGDSNFATSSGATTQTVNKAASSTMLSSSPNPSTLNQQVTFTATVTGPGNIPPSGTVTFTEGGTTLGTGTLTNGAASYQTSSLTVGQNSITATYNGDSNFATSFGTTTQTVSGQIQTIVRMSADPNPATFGQPITFKAIVTNEGPVPTGNITISEPLGPNNVPIYAKGDLGPDGVATIIWTPPTGKPNTLTPGTHSLSVTYGGDSNYPATHTDGYILTITDDVSSSPAGFDFSKGFSAASARLQLNGSAGLDGSKLQLTDGDQNQAGSAFYATPVNVQSFTSDFAFQLSEAEADGLTFTIQNAGAKELGSQGGSLGYAGIGKSVAIKFDIYNNAGEGDDSTGLYIDGEQPCLPSVDLTKTGIDLGSGHSINAHITYDGTTLNLTLTDTVTKSTWSHAFTVNIPVTVGGNTAYVGFTGGTGGLTANQEISSWTFTSGQPPVPDFSNGFSAAAAQLQLNGSAEMDGSKLQLTDGDQNQAGSAFYATPVNIQSFATDFAFQLSEAEADGFTFTMQNVGGKALGSAGGSLGYAGIGRSVAIKFDIYNNAGEGDDSTGIFSNGEQPCLPSVDLTKTGIDLSSGHSIKAHVTYDGTALNLTLTDTVTQATWSHAFTVNIPATVGGTTAYVGFTGATGGLTANQEISSWTFTPAHD